MAYKIATWNVNSIKVRVEQVIDWLEGNEIDVLALQEIKCLDEQFPFDAFFEAGYEIVVSGQKTYNGVAVLSRSEAVDVKMEMPGFDDPQKRLLALTIDGIRLYNVYVPNGQSLESDKFQYKLRWLEAFTALVEAEKATYPNQLILGDFNIAPTDRDVFDVKEWRDCLLVSEKERRALRQLLKLGFIDSFRLFKQRDDLFSWWDYRDGNYQKNKGLRIDLILMNEPLVERCINSAIDPTPRGWLRPSDHAPVFTVLNS
jgi:exodeoxyribonuclease-3